MARVVAKNTRAAYIAEVTENVTPPTPAFSVLRVTGEQLDVERKLVFSSELDGRRGEKNYAVASASGSGSLPFEMSDGTFESLFESALRSTWAADAMVDGTTPKPFSLEVTYEGGATDIYKRLTGAHVSTLSLALRAGEIVTGTLGFMSRGAAFANAPIAGAVYTGAAADPIFVGADFAGLTLAGLTVGCVASLDLNINNNLDPQYCLGSLGPDAIAAGKLEVTGSLSIYLDSDEFDVLTAYQDGVSTSLLFTLGRTAGQKLTVNLPTIVLENTRVAAESTDGSVIMEVPFRALQSDSIGGSVIQLTRNV